MGKESKFEKLDRFIKQLDGLRQYLATKTSGKSNKELEKKLKLIIPLADFVNDEVFSDDSESVDFETLKKQSEPTKIPARELEKRKAVQEMMENQMKELELIRENAVPNIIRQTTQPKS